MMTDKTKTPQKIFLQENYGKQEYGIEQDDNIHGMVRYFRCDEDYNKIKGVLAIALMDYLDNNRPEGKMCLSNGECQNIDNAFAIGDWDKIYAYIKKKLEKQVDQKPTDKAEPKFKVGDWILYSSDNYKGIHYITKIDENGYYTERNGLPYGIIPFNHEICMRLWTIEDAKAGDVLAFDNDTIVIFKDLYNATTFHSYCHIEDGIFNFNEEGLPDWWEGAGFHPTIMEQRNILFTKIKEAGYEWDANNLKLLKKQNNKNK